MAQSRLELALILYFAQTYLVLVTLLELGLFIYKVGRKIATRDHF